MIITNDFVFIHFPKNASTFVTICIEELYDKTTNKNSSKNFKDNFTYLYNKEKTNYNTLYVSETLGYKGISKKTRHQGCDEIPKKHKYKPILSTIRNPFDRYVSLYHYGWWKENPSLEKEILYKKFPSFPDLTFKQYFNLLFNHTLKQIKQKNNFTLNIGVTTLYYLKYFCRDYMKKMATINNVGELNEEDFYDVHLLKKENLNSDLYDYLFSLGWPKKRLEFILEKSKVNTSRKSSSYHDYYDDEMIETVMEKDAFIFELFPMYKF